MKKYLWIAVTLLFSLGIVVGFHYYNEKEEASIECSKIQNKEDEEKNIILEVGINADFAEDCGSLSELNRNADHVILGTIVNAQAWCDEVSTVYTDYTVEIENVYKGKLESGNQIVITDIGGVIDAEEYFKYQNDPKILPYKEMSKSESEAYVQYKFEGSWLPKENGKYVWYLEDNSVGNEKHYNPVNDYQGVFAVTEKSIQRYEPNQMDEENKIGKIAISKVKKSIKRK